MGAMTPETVTRFWLDDVGPEGWYKQDDALDAEITARFGAIWEEARRGGLETWRCSAERGLAYILLTDQFPRNMFRGSAQAFATDRRAVACAKLGIRLGWDLRTPEPQRQFYYLPLEHSETAEDQARAVRLIMTRMPASDGTTLLHARAHREIIRRFGRFPFRNDAMGRVSTLEEKTFLANGAYGGVLRTLQAH